MNARPAGGESHASGLAGAAVAAARRRGDRRCACSSARQHGDRRAAHRRLASGAALGALLLLLLFDLAALLNGVPERCDSANGWRSAAAAGSPVLRARRLQPADGHAGGADRLDRAAFLGHLSAPRAAFQRFFLGMCLFLAGMLLIVLAGNAVLAFVGWELAGSAPGCSSPTPGSDPWRPATRSSSSSPTASATPASCSASASRCGRWAASNGPRCRRRELGVVSARLLAAGFVLAALVKSAQLPFTPWIARALEGPTPSSAVFYGSLMVHAGVFPALSSAGTAAAGARPAGAAGRRRSGDGLVRRPLRAGAERRQVGADLLDRDPGRSDVLRSAVSACSGWPPAIPACTPPGAPTSSCSRRLHASGAPAGAPGAALAGRQRWLYSAALQRFWIEPLASSLLTRPTLALGRDVRALDEQFHRPPAGHAARRSRRHKPCRGYGRADPRPRLRRSRPVRLCRMAAAHREPSAAQRRRFDDETLRVSATTPMPSSRCSNNRAI
jgi:hypothetical protein